MPTGLTILLILSGILIVVAVTMLLVIRDILNTNGYDPGEWDEGNQFYDFPNFILQVQDPRMQKHYRIMWRLYVWSAIFGSISTISAIAWLLFYYEDQIPIL